MLTVEFDRMADCKLEGGFYCWLVVGFCCVGFFFRVMMDFQGLLDPKESE